MQTRKLELEADFQQFYGLDIGGMGSDYTVEHAANLAVMLPRESRVMAAENESNLWGLESILLSSIEYWTHCIAFSLSNGKGDKPERIYNPQSKTKKNSSYDIDELKEILKMPRR